MVSPVEFCQAFIDNDQKIGYTFRREFPEFKRNGEKTYDIIINGMSWRLYFHVNHSLTFVDPNRQSKESPFFGPNYSMAACIKSDSMSCYAYLFHKTDWKQVVIGSITKDDYNEEKELSEYTQHKTVTIKTLKVKPAFAFGQEVKVRDTKLVLIEKSINGSLTPHIANVYKDGKVLPDQTKSTDFDGIKKLNTNYEVIGIMSDVSAATKGVIFLFSDNLKVRYMWCSADGRMDDCKSKVPEVLVDCPPIPTKGVKPSGSLLTLILVIIVITVVIVIAIVVVFYIRNRNHKKKDNLKKKRSKSRTKTSNISSSVAKSGPQTSAAKKEKK